MARNNRRSAAAAQSAPTTANPPTPNTHPKRDRLDWLNFGVLFLTFVAASVAAWEAISLAKLTEIAVDDGRKNFQKGERPYIWLVNESVVPQLVMNPNGKMQVHWNWKYTNYGKIPALKVTLASWMKLGEKEFETNHGTSRPGSSAPLPPTKVDFSTTLSAPISGRAEFQRLFAIDRGIEIRGIITYSDAYDNKYETTFCLAKLASNAVMYCEPSDIR